MGYSEIPSEATGYSDSYQISSPCHCQKPLYPPRATQIQPLVDILNNDNTDNVPLDKEAYKYV